MLVDLQLSGAKQTRKGLPERSGELGQVLSQIPGAIGRRRLKAYLLYLMKERHLSEEPFGSMWPALNSYTERR